MKFYKYWVALACIGLIVSPYLPWAYYPDLDKTFTGFFSERDLYGKPGKVFIFLAVVSFAFALIHKVWAKRSNLLIGALTIAYTIKTYLLYTTCYGGVCPEKQYGIFILVLSALLLMVTALFPDMKIDVKSQPKKIEEDE